MLNQANVATRYPEDLSRLQSDYPKARVQELLKRGKEVLEWIRQ